MTFFYVYVLRSLITDYIYIGFTHDLKRRVEEHNSKQNQSTKPYAPYEIIHYEAYRNRKDARRREEYLKCNRGKTTLNTMLKCFLTESMI